MSKENPDRYQLHYNSYLPPHRQLWVIQKDDLCRAGDTLYKVKQVVRPQIKGMKPKLVVEKINELPEQLPSSH